jgi:hypothetical protein
MKSGYTHIAKEDFFPAFFAAFQASMTGKKIQGGFRGIGLVPYSPGSILSKLDLKFATLSPPGTATGDPQPWTSRILINSREAVLQHDFLRD